MSWKPINVPVFLVTTPLVAPIGQTIRSSLAVATLDARDAIPEVIPRITYTTASVPVAGCIRPIEVMVPNRPTNGPVTPDT